MVEDLCEISVLSFTSIEQVRMDDIMCPNCGTTKYRNPKLRLLINVCGHSFCEKCVEILFSRGSCLCYECRISLRRANFRYQKFDDPKVDKEVDIRKKVTKELNLFEDDFESLREFNDFLESVEDFIYNLTNNINVEETRARIEKIKQEKKQCILNNRYKISKDQQEIKEQLQLERESFEELRRKVAMEETLIQQAKRENQASLLKELETSSLPANQIVTRHQKDVNTLFEKSSDASGQDGNGGPSDLNSEEMEKGYSYEQPKIDTMGPRVPLESFNFSESSLGLLSFVYSPGDEALAGGYYKEYACTRALSDAYNCLLF